MSQESRSEFEIIAEKSTWLKQNRNGATAKPTKAEAKQCFTPSWVFYGALLTLMVYFFFLWVVDNCAAKKKKRV